MSQVKPISGTNNWSLFYSRIYKPCNHCGLKKVLKKFKNCPRCGLPITQIKNLKVSKPDD